MATTDVRVQKGEGWAVVRLSSTRGLNKLGTATLVPLRRELRTILSGDCSCLAIVGEGESFAVGADLREIGGLTSASARSFSDLGNSIFRLLENSETVVLAGIDGFCLGGGLDLALAADWRIATTRSVFGHPGADLGLITGFGGTQRLSRLIGRNRAMEWLFTARRVGAEEAQRSGLVQELCAPDNFEESLLNRMGRFAGMSRQRAGRIKMLFRDLGDPGPGLRSDYAPAR